MFKHIALFAVIATLASSANAHAAGNISAKRYVSHEPHAAAIARLNKAATLQSNNPLSRNAVRTMPLWSSRRP